MIDKIFNKFKYYILLVANKKYPPIRKRKYDLTYYLTNFVYILNDVNKWSSLKLIYKNERKTHWKSIYNEYIKWVNDKIFEDAFNILINEKYFKLSKIRKNKQINLLIDSTKINNKLGSEGVTINGENRKKNVTEIMFITDHNKLPLAFKLTKINKTIYNGRKTASSEIKNVQQTLNKININVKKYVKCNIIADRGYISKEKFTIFNNELNIITPKRKNQKIRNTQIEKNLLKCRYKIENFFMFLKKNARINVRNEKKYIYFESFIYMTLIEYYAGHLIKNKL
jgi:hypothetical protein